MRGRPPGLEGALETGEKTWSREVGGRDASIGSEEGGGERTSGGAGGGRKRWDKIILLMVTHVQRAHSQD